MSEENVTCRYCNRALHNPECMGEAMVSIEIYKCKHCKSEQTYDQTHKLIRWSFVVEAKYNIEYWPGQKLLQISERKGGDFKSVCKIKTKEDPDYMTPDSMTEDRIKTIIVFS